MVKKMKKKYILNLLKLSKFIIILHLVLKIKE